MKNVMKRTIVSLLAGVVILTGAFPAGVQAASAIGTVTVGGSTTSYTDLGELVDAVDDYNNNTIRIEMLADWGNKRLVIPKNSNTTLNMNGHIYDRGLSGSKSDRRMGADQPDRSRHHSHHRRHRRHLRP